MTQLIVVRHGESHGNLLGLFMGWGNMPLTPRGRQQAALTREFLKNERIDAAYASPLVRAFETASIVVGDRAISVFPENDLRELFGGDWESVPYTEIETRYPADYRLWRQDLGAARPTNGETVAALYDRVKRVMLEIAARHENETVLVASHATPIRVFQTAALGLPVSEVCRVPWPANAAVSRYRVEGETIACEGYSMADYMGEMRTELPKNI